MLNLKALPEWASATPQEKAMARMAEEVLQAIGALVLHYDLPILDGMGAAACALFAAMNAAIDTYAEHRPGTEGAVREQLAASVRALVEEMEARPIGGEEAKAPVKERQAWAGHD